MRRADIIASARRWIGTPYRHQASCCGAGCDCLGLVRGIWREQVGVEPVSLPAYTPDWAERNGQETLLDAARQYFQERCLETAAPGDVLLFRPRRDGPAKHCAILAAPGRIIHAYWGRAVAETALTPWWQTRCVAAFSFPDLED